MLGAADPLELIADPSVAKLLGVSLRSIARWDADPENDFPKPIVINARKFRRRLEIETWLHNRALASLPANAKRGRPPLAKSPPSPAKKTASPAAANASQRKRRA